MLRRFVSLTGLFLALGIFVSRPAAGADNFLNAGIAEYKKGNFADAAGHFGGALTTDFNNAKLHYYMGSCYAHMKQKEAAIREFRIAYALEPDNEVGQFSKQALNTYGADTTGPVETKVSTTANLSKMLPPVAGAAPPVAPAPSALDKQLNDLKNLRAEESRAAGASASQQGDEYVKRMTKDLLDSMRYTTRRGTVVQPNLSNDDQARLENVRKSYYGMRDSLLQSGNRQQIELQNSADALRSQMNEQAKAGKVHLSTSGTNLYVRNYETPGSTPLVKPNSANSSSSAAGASVGTSVSTPSGSASGSSIVSTGCSASATGK